MKTFTSAGGFRYPVFVITKNQGRGMDFPTNHDIEASGGVHVIIASMPSYFLEFQ
jgi:hypothetical protein